MAWPTKPNDGEAIESQTTVDIIDALASWGGNVAANGFSLSNLGALSVTGDIAVGNSGGDTHNTFRVDGFANAFYLAADSAAGASTGTSIILRTAPAGTGSGADRLTIDPAGLVSMPQSAGVGGVASGWRRFNVSDAGRSYTESTSGVASFAVATGPLNTDQGILMGNYNVAGSEYGWIQSIKAGSATYLLALNPAGGNVQVGANGSWNAGHLQLGANIHLWVDSSFRLRIKNGAPTSDTDGTVVGTQS